MFPIYHCKPSDNGRSDSKPSDRSSDKSSDKNDDSFERGLMAVVTGGVSEVVISIMDDLEKNL